MAGLKSHITSNVKATSYQYQSHNNITLFVDSISCTCCPTVTTTSGVVLSVNAGHTKIFILKCI